MHMQLAIWEEESNASVEQSEMSLWPVAGQMLVHNTVALPLAAVNSKGNSEMKHQKNLASLSRRTCYKISWFWLEIGVQSYQMVDIRGYMR